MEHATIKHSFITKQPSIEIDSEDSGQQKSVIDELKATIDYQYFVYFLEICPIDE